jgi:hypothetical protein
MAKRKVSFILTAVNHTKKGFSAASKGLSIVNKGAMGTAKTLLGVGAAATAAAASIGFFVEKNVSALDKLGKTANKLGVDVKFLQQFRFAAEQTGIEVRTLDMGLQRFIRRVAEASQGTGEAKGALKQLGIEFKDAAGNARPIQDILFDVADGMAATSSEGEKVRLAFKFFDSEGVALVNTLKGGSAELKAFFDQAENLGILIDKDTTKKAEKFADQLNIIKKQFTAITQNLTGAFLPILQTVSEKLTAFMTKTKEDAGGFKKVGQDMAAAILDGTIGFMTSFASLMDNIGAFFQNIGKNTTAIGLSMAALHLHTLKVRQSLFGLFTDLSAEIEEAEGSVHKLDLELVEKSIPYLNTFGIAAAKARGILLTFKDSINATNEALEGGAGGGEGDKLKPLLVGMQKFNDEIGNTQENLGKAAVGSMKKFEDSMVEGIKNGKFEFKSFADYAIEQLLRIAIQEIFLKKLTTSFSSFFSSAGSLIPSFSGGGYSGMGARAGGVDGKGGFPAILHPNETVVDHTKGQSTGGGANITFNIQANDAAGFDQLLNSRKQMITAMINNAMNNRGKMGVV